MTTAIQFNLIDKAAIRKLREEINAALIELGAKHGISIVAGDANISESLTTFKLNVALGEGKTGVDVRNDKYAQDLKRYAFMLTDIDLEATYKIRGKLFKIIGYNARGKQYPIIAQDLGSDLKYKLAIDDFTPARIVKA